jgi:hypothetical protein
MIYLELLLVGDVNDVFILFYKKIILDVSGFTSFQCNYGAKVALHPCIVEER